MRSDIRAHIQHDALCHPAELCYFALILTQIRWKQAVMGIHDERAIRQAQEAIVLCELYSRSFIISSICIHSFFLCSQLFSCAHFLALRAVS